MTGRTLVFNAGTLIPGAQRCTRIVLRTSATLNGRVALRFIAVAANARRAQTRRNLAVRSAFSRTLPAVAC